jgi:hypothetical protein
MVRSFQLPVAGVSFSVSGNGPFNDARFRVVDRPCSPDFLCCTHSTSSSLNGAWRETNHAKLSFLFDVCAANCDLRC